MVKSNTISAEWRGIFNVEEVKNTTYVVEELGMRLIPDRNTDKFSAKINF